MSFRSWLKPSKRTHSCSRKRQAKRTLESFRPRLENLEDRTLLSVTDPGCANDGLVGLWHGDSNTSDAVGVNHGSVIGNLTYSASSHGSAFNLNGTNAYVTVPDSPALRFEGDFSLSFWMNKASEAPDHQRLAGKGQGASRNYGVYEEAGNAKRLIFQ